MTYKEQIKHPKWQKKRLEILERDQFTCFDCKSKDKQLHVHHLGYIKDAKIWEYDNNQLITLCDICHKNIHNYIDKLKESIYYQRHASILLEIINLHENIKGLNSIELTIINEIILDIKKIKYYTHG